MVSVVNDATCTKTRNYDAEQIIESIRTDGRNKLCGPIEKIRLLYRATLKTTGDRKAGKKAVAADKKKLPGVLWSGRFSRRANDALSYHSGLLCADLDELGDRLAEVLARLARSPHLWALFLLLTGDGLKAVFRVAAEAGEASSKLSRSAGACRGTYRRAD